MKQRALIFFLVAGLATCRQQLDKAGIPRAVSGTLDLRSHDFKSSGSIDLDGEWEYYPGQLVQPEELIKKTESKKIAVVPGSFNSYEDPKLRLPPVANATYRLVLLLPDKLDMYVIRVPSPNSASRVFINNHPELEAGHVSEKPKEVVAKARMQYFQGPLAGKTEILIQISNVKNRRGGIWQRITIGEATHMIGERLKAITIDVSIATALITIALYHLALWLLRSPDKSIIFYGIFCLMAGFRRLFTDEQLIANLLPDLS